MVEPRLAEALTALSACAQSGSWIRKIFRTKHEQKSFEPYPLRLLFADQSLCLAEGVVDGRQSVQEVDGAVIISSLAQMKDRIDVELLKVEPCAGRTFVTLGFKNGTDIQLRLINLKQAGALLAIDQGGYANNLTISPDNADEITVPPKAAIRHRFSFESTDDVINAVRLWGQAFSELSTPGNARSGGATSVNNLPYSGLRLAIQEAKAMTKKD